MKRSVPFFVLIGLLMMGWLAIHTMAQDTPQPCSAADVLDVQYEGIIEREWIESVAITLTTAQDSSMSEWLEAAREMHQTLACLEAKCRGLFFESYRNGQNPAIGPISLEDGTWRVTLVTDLFTDGATWVELTPINGDCGKDLIFSVAKDPYDNTFQTVLQTTSCETMITIETTSEGYWSLMFELVAPAED